MTRILELQREPDSIIESQNYGSDDRKKEIKGICQRIVVSTKVAELEGCFGETNGINRSWTIARDSYVVGLYDASIVFSSIAVECALNNDMKMNPDTRSNNWVTLNKKTLKKMGKQNLPVEALLESDESIDDEDLPLFVKNRNKVAHGDFGLYKTQFSRYHPKTGHIIEQSIVDISSQDALVQFLKCSKFLKSWVKQNPELRFPKISKISAPET